MPKLYPYTLKGEGGSAGGQKLAVSQLILMGKLSRNEFVYLFQKYGLIMLCELNFFKSRISELEISFMPVK